MTRRRLGAWLAAGLTAGATGTALVLSGVGTAGASSACERYADSQAQQDASPAQTQAAQTQAAQTQAAQTRAAQTQAVQARLLAACTQERSPALPR